MNTYKKHKRFSRVNAQNDMFTDLVSLDPGLDYSNLPEGKSGFSKAIKIIKQMVEQGYEDIDIVIKLHEEVPKEIAEVALKQCRDRGVL